MSRFGLGLALLNASAIVSVVSRFGLVLAWLNASTTTRVISRVGLSLALLKALATARVIYILAAQQQPRQDMSDNIHVPHRHRHGA